MREIFGFKRITALYAGFNAALTAFAASNGEAERAAVEKARTALLGYTSRGKGGKRHRMARGCMSRTLQDRSRYMPAVEDRKHAMGYR